MLFISIIFFANTLHVNAGGFPLRDEGSIPDKTVVFPQFGNETLRSHVNVFHKPS